MGDIDVFTFEANAGENIFYVLGKTSGDLGPHVTIVSPTGEIVADDSSSSSNHISATLTETGQYTIVAGPARTKWFVR